GFTAAGCAKCLHTGYKGRVLIAELVELDTQLRQGILNRADAETLAEIIAARGHVTLEQNTLRLVREGIISQ
ncbi:MAG: hypothetical protein JXM68_06600, partial [Sedimentisphaerales bacterium]|nr:hypothetical protein [Sedimentisphaerales bacterium]